MIQIKLQLQLKKDKDLQILCKSLKQIIDNLNTLIYQRRDNYDLGTRDTKSGIFNIWYGRNHNGYIIFDQRKRISISQKTAWRITP